MARGDDVNGVSGDKPAGDDDERGVTAVNGARRVASPYIGVNGNAQRGVNRQARHLQGGGAWRRRTLRWKIVVTGRRRSRTAANGAAAA